MTESQLQFCFGFSSRPAIRWRKPRTFRERILRCGICAVKWPAFFDVPDTVWEHYVPPDARDHIVCIACWRKLVVATDAGDCQRAHGGPLALWCPAWRKRHSIPENEPLDPSRLSMWWEGVLAGVPEHETKPHRSRNAP
jgi:hypothetical protein